MTRPSFTCPACQATSYHPEDVANRYCGRCHRFVDDPTLEELGHAVASAYRKVVEAIVAAMAPSDGPLADATFRAGCVGMSSDRTRTVLPPAGPPPVGTCDHCGCQVIDWSNGWEYVEPDERCPEYDGGVECPDAPGGIVYHTVGGKERA